MKRISWTLIFSTSIILFFCSICFAGEAPKLLITPETISKKIRSTALKIDNKYKGQELVVVMVMKGAICVTADLIRNLTIPVTLEYLNTSITSKNEKINGTFGISGLDQTHVKNKNILVVDDVFDSGATMVEVIKYLKERGARNIETLSLIAMNKPKKKSYYPDYVLFRSNKDFKGLSGEKGTQYIVGYGIDYEERFRELPGIYIHTVSKKETKKN